MNFFPGSGNTSQSSIFQHSRSLLGDLQLERISAEEVRHCCLSLSSSHLTKGRKNDRLFSLRTAWVVLLSRTYV